MKNYRTSIAVLVVLTALSAGGCREQNAFNSSKLDVTDVQHTPVKRQSIGNCWLYATSTWAESLHLTATGETKNVSESYWTYWHFYSQLPYASKKIQTGGHWYTASNIISQHGWMEEGDFLPAESELEMSAVQAAAEAFVNKELAEGGRLERYEDRTDATLRTVLDEAFGVQMATLTDRIKSAADFVVGRSATGENIGLDQIIAGSQTVYEWRHVSYPQAYGRNSGVTPSQSQNRKFILQRVMLALNAAQPVIMSVMVDFNGLKHKPYATFDLETLNAAGMGRQGGHLLALEDYTVKNVPGLGELGEGDMTPEIKAKAALGDLVTLKAKNSWGANRPERGLIDGHTAFTFDYLNAVLPWAYEEGSTDPNRASWYSPLSQFILPPGY